jgi:hypothetical protein
VCSFIGTQEFSTNLFDQIYSLMFVKDSKTVTLMKNGHHHDADDREEKKIQGFSKNFLLRGLIDLNLGNWNRFMSIKAKIHALSNDLRRNL